MLSFCTPYFSVILPALLHFCSFIFTAFRVQVANLCAKIGRFLRTKRAWSEKFAGASPPDPLSLSYPRGHGPPRFFRLEQPLTTAAAQTKCGMGLRSSRAKLCSNWSDKDPHSSRDTGQNRLDHLRLLFNTSIGGVGSAFSNQN